MSWLPGNLSCRKRKILTTKCKQVISSFDLVSLFFLAGILSVCLHLALLLLDTPPSLLQEINEMVHTERPDWQSVMTYVTAIYKYFETWLLTSASPLPATCSTIRGTLFLPELSANAPSATAIPHCPSSTLFYGAKSWARPYTTGAKSYVYCYTRKPWEVTGQGRLNQPRMSWSTGKSCGSGVALS